MSQLIKLSSKFLPKRPRRQLWRKMNWKRYSDHFDAAIQQFVIEKGITDKNEIRNVRKKLIKAFVKDNWNPDEYFFFNYERLSRKGIQEFVPNREASLFWKFQNTREMYLLTCDKGKTYSCFKRFFHRDVIFISEYNEDSLCQFKSFTDKHKKFITKPNFGNLGNGVQIIDTSKFGSIEDLLKGLLETYKEGLVAEELSVQCKELAAFHPSSVNTIRLTTARLSNGEIYIINRAFIRFGQGGRCVDNAGNGGIFGGIDFNTGIIKGTIDERVNKYVVHPDTGKTILGYKIPKWEEAKAFVLELAKELPDLNYCGWDLALTDDGWVMVEANGKGLFIGFQMPTQEGFRDEFEKLKKLCGFNE